MSTVTSILFTSGVFISIFITVKSNYVRHRDNILNKGVWVKNNNDKVFDKTGFGEFIFKPNSVNVDELLQDDFYSFGGNNVQDTPFIPSYNERAKRSPNLLEKGFPKSVKDCTDKECKSKIDKTILSSKFTQNYNNPALLTVYPYDVAVLLSNVKNNNKYMLEEIMDKSKETFSEAQMEAESNQMNHTNKTFKVIMANEILVDNSKDNSSITTLPKRSMDKNSETEVIKKIEIVEGFNESKKSDRNIFDDKMKDWHQNAFIPNVNTYKVIPKTAERTAVSERGLLKLLAILTKTFKKIMKQHVEIKKIHAQMFAGKDDIDKSVSLLIKKFNDFEVKYANLKDHNQKLQELQKKLEAKEEYFKNKETEMSHNLADFENQQKKFLTQQRQFYNIQKLMLSQNEKINAKQSLIARTQSEISRRQNNFARILKKAKQIYVDRKQTNPKSQSKIANNNETETKPATTTAIPGITDSVKIDLFSIPSMDALRFENQDKLILKEKDEHPVDDLVYKYYFNNTFIDNLMKNQILTGPLNGNKYITRNAKSKRNQAKKIKSTILIPIDNNTIDVKPTEAKANENRRAKRWIRHHSKGKARRRHRKIKPDYEIKDDKNPHGNINNNLIDDLEKYIPTQPMETKRVPEKSAQANIINPFISLEKLAKSVERHLNPFTTMAANFCNQIGQNGNPLMLSWCIEKVLRRLHNIETIPVVATLPKKIPMQTSTPQTTRVSVTNTAPTTQTIYTSTRTYVTTPPSVPTQMETQTTSKPPVTTTTSATPNPTPFFPDNEELESNLKQFELKADDEGTVYYEGSVHASDMIGHDEDGFSDIMPGVDSNSRIEMDPLTFDLPSIRRGTASNKRMSDKMLKKQKGIV